MVKLTSTYLENGRDYNWISMKIFSVLMCHLKSSSRCNCFHFETVEIKLDAKARAPYSVVMATIWSFQHHCCVTDYTNPVHLQCPASVRNHFFLSFYLSSFCSTSNAFICQNAPLFPRRCALQALAGKAPCDLLQPPIMTSHTVVCIKAKLSVGRQHAEKEGRV